MIKKNIEIEKNIETIDWQTHEEWLRLRKTGIGGSDAGAITGANPYKSAFDVWADKLNLAPEQEDNEAMRQGRDLEAYVADRFEELTKKKVRIEKRIIKNKKYPFAYANIDRQLESENAILECKTTTEHGPAAGGKLPETYRKQCVHYLAVTGADRAYIAVLTFGKEFHYHVIERNKQEIEQLMREEELFWNEYVIKKKRPPMQGIEKTSGTLNSMFKQKEKSCRLTCENEILRYINLKKRIAILEREALAMEQSIKYEMKDSIYGNFSGGLVVWKEAKRRTLDKNKLKKVLADLEPYYTETVSRKFEIIKG